MAERIKIRQGIEHSITATNLPTLSNDATWLAILFNKAANRRFVATRSEVSGATKFTWKSGVIRNEDGTFTPQTSDQDYKNSTAAMPEGIYDLEFISSDLTMGGATTQKGQYEVVKSSVMAKNQ